MPGLEAELWAIMRSQPGVGVLIIDADGRVLFCNPQAQRIYYGNDFDPVGLTIAEIEGNEFAAERMAVIRDVLATGRPQCIRHIRGGKRTEAVIWPLRGRPPQQPRIISITRQGLETGPADGMPVFASELEDWGPLDVLTRRELQVLALIGHGVPLKTAALQLGITQRSVERYRTDIARKLKVRSIAEIAQLVQRAGLDVDSADLDRLHRWREG
jgi:DNA-binding CsgD family transcriptional regulator